jgi:hypothetical protein
VCYSMTLFGYHVRKMVDEKNNWLISTLCSLGSKLHNVKNVPPRFNTNIRV